MKNYLQEVYETVEKKIQENGRTVVFVEAGHFKAHMDANGFSITSLNDAIFLGKSLIKKFKNQVRMVFGILIDDLGQECSADVCSISSSNNSTKEDNIIPEKLRKILQEERYIKLDRVLIFSERTAKNRSIKRLKQAITNENPCISTEPSQDSFNFYFHNQSQEKVLLAKGKGEIFNAYCPSIMGQHYADIFMKLKERFFENEHFIIIDWSEILDKSKVSNGSQAFKKVFNVEKLEKMNLGIINIFFGDQEGNFYQIDETVVKNIINQ